MIDWFPIVLIFVTAASPMVMAWLVNRNNDAMVDRVVDLSVKLDDVHVLVNSNMTTIMQSEFGAVTRELAMMLEVIELKKLNGHQPSAEVLTAVDLTRIKLAELRSTLEDRSK